MDLIETHEDVMRSLVAEVLAEGNRNNAFAVDDIVATAEIILKATILFHSPLIQDRNSLSELEYFAEEILKLLVRGMKPQ